MLSGKRDTKTLERAFSPKIEPPNSYTLKSGQLEWFQCDVNSRGSKNEPIKLVRASDEGLLLQMPAHSTHPDSPLYHTFELKADNIGSMPIVKHCSNSVIQSRYKKGLLICKKNSNNSWSSLVLCQREDKLNPDTDPEKWRDTIVKELFAQKEYKSDFMLMCGADKFAVHCSDKFVSIVPECRPFRKREQLIDYCLTIKEKIWTRQNFVRACIERGPHSFSIKNLSGIEYTYRIISNKDIDCTLQHLWVYVDGPPTMTSREPTNPVVPPRQLPITVPRVNPNRSCAPLSKDAPPAFFVLPSEEIKKTVKPPVPEVRKPPLEKSESVYQEWIQARGLPVSDPVYKTHKMKKLELTRKITSKPHSERLSELIEPTPPARRETTGSSREGRTVEDIDKAFESMYDYRGFKEVAPRNNAHITHTKSIDMTLYEILQKVPRSLHLRTMKYCDMGLGTSRIPFVLRLEMTDWQEFAWKLFGNLMTAPDYDLINEFACRMNIPPVEIILIHWKRLADINDGSTDIPTPGVEAIRQILTDLDLIDIRDIIDKGQPDPYDPRSRNYPTL